VQVPALVSVHVAVLVLAVRVHVAVGGVPSPVHAAEQVAPTVLLLQPVTQAALLMATVGITGHTTAQAGNSSRVQLGHVCKHALEGN
jgi:uncharacterized membrane protein